MAKECLIIGQPNVGKSLFAINLVEFLGNSVIEMVISEPGRKVSNTYSLAQARLLLVSDEQHFTRYRQSIRATISKGKGKKNIMITDTGGLSDGIHPNWEIRRSMALTISYIKEAKIILHLIDVNELGAKGCILGLKDIDYQIAQFARETKGYLIIANKIDLPYAEEGLDILRREFDDINILPVSALYKTGFAEVKANVARLV